MILHCLTLFLPGDVSVFHSLPLFFLQKRLILNVIPSSQSPSGSRLLLLVYFFPPSNHPRTFGAVETVCCLPPVNRFENNSAQKGSSFFVHLLFCSFLYRSMSGNSKQSPQQTMCRFPASNQTQEVAVRSPYLHFYFRSEKKINKGWPDIVP